MVNDEYQAEKFFRFLDAIKKKKDDEKKEELKRKLNMHNFKDFIVNNIGQAIDWKDLYDSKIFHQSRELNDKIQ